MHSRTGRRRGTRVERTRWYARYEEEEEEEVRTALLLDQPSGT